MLVAANRLVSSTTLILGDSRRIAALDQGNGIAQRFDPQREEGVEIERPRCVVRCNRRPTLNQNWASVDSLVRPKPCHPGLRVAFNEGPRDRASPAMARQ